MAWTELFTTDIGLLSLFTIAFILGMAIYLYIYVSRHMKDSPDLGNSTKLPPKASH